LGIPLRDDPAHADAFASMTGAENRGEHCTLAFNVKVAAIARFQPGGLTNIEA
jgi:hypothetical protein